MMVKAGLGPSYMTWSAGSWHHAVDVPDTLATHAGRRGILISRSKDTEAHGRLRYCKPERCRKLGKKACEEERHVRCQIRMNWAWWTLGLCMQERVWVADVRADLVARASVQPQ